MHMVKRVTEVRESECSVICLNIVKPHFYTCNVLLQSTKLTFHSPWHVAFAF